MEVQSTPTIFVNGEKSDSFHTPEDARLELNKRLKGLEQ